MSRQWHENMNRGSLSSKTLGPLPALLGEAATDLIGHEVKMTPRCSNKII